MKRKAFLALGLSAILTVVVLLVAASASNLGTKVFVSEKHLSIEVPEGWMYDRNISSGGVLVDLVMYGLPNGGQLVPYFTLGTFPWYGTVSEEAIYQAQTVQLDGLRGEPGVSNLSFVYPPSNITVDGERANRCTVSFLGDGRELVMMGLVVASDEWNLTYALSFFDDYSNWAEDSYVCDQVIESIHFEDKENPEPPLIVALLFAVGVVAIIVVVMMLLRRRRRSVQTTLPSLQEAVDEFFHEPSVIGRGEPRKPTGPPGNAGGPASRKIGVSCRS